MKLNRLLIGSIAVACVAATVASSNKPAANGGELSAAVMGDSTKKLGVKPIHDADNVPTPGNHKQPLDPYGSSSEEDESTSLLAKLVMPISMIVVSEIGDKTFLIAALMAMKHSRFVVFTSAFSSLAVMTVLSGIIGHALPSLISQRLTQFLASILFIVFGYKLLMEGLAMPKDLGVDEELAEVEEELASSKINSNLNDIELGSTSGSASHEKPWYVSLGENVQNLAAFVLSPIWIQVFVMTFLGEWGDRSQIAIIAMAGVPNYWVIILGAVIGHGLCTFAACLGGKLLAKRISLRNVTLSGAAAFIIFAFIYFFDALNGEA